MSLSEKHTRYKLARRLKGWCYDCDNPPAPNRTRCERHLRRSLKYNTDQYQKHGETMRLGWRAKRLEYRAKALQVYGKSCACCGEARVEFLQIDHIDNSGARHRKEDPSSKDLAIWLQKNNYPPGFRTLCSNCNWARRRDGPCPHELERSCAENFTY